MFRLKLWDGLQIAGALASLVGVAGVLSSAPQLSIALAVTLLGGVFATIAASVLARRAPQSVGRDAMIQTGQRLIRHVKSEAVMFGGDMSWASDYEEAIRGATSSGKKVCVLYPKSDAAKVRRNAQIVSDAGAELHPTIIDSGLRAILVDPNDSKDAMLYVASRTLRHGSVPVQSGDQGSERTYQYVAKVYTMSQDWVIIQAARKVYDVLASGEKA